MSRHARHHRRRPLVPAGSLAQSRGGHHARTGWRRLRRNLSPETRAAMALAVLATALVTLPWGCAQVVAGRRLQGRLDAVRQRAHALQRELDALRSAAALPDAAPPATNAAAVPPKSPDPASRRPAPALGSAAAAIPEAEAASLRESLVWLPNGVHVPAAPGGGAPAATTLAPFAAPLAQAYAALEGGQPAKAAEVFAALSQAWPEWPYGHFYLALATRTRKPMEDAARVFARADLLGIVPPEGELYWGLAALFLGDTARARERLTGLEERLGGRRPGLGPLFRPAGLPADLRRTLDGIAPLASAHPAPVLR